MRRHGIMCNAGSDLVPEYAVQRQRRRIQRLLDYEDGERRRVAQRLEQEAAQALVAAVLQLSPLEAAAQDPATRERLAALHGALSALVDDLRQLAADLYSPVLEGLGLTAALEELAETAALELRPVAVVVDPRVGELPCEVARTIHRLAEEMLKATAGPLEIRVRRRDAERVELVVTTGEDELGGRVVDASRLVLARVRTELRGGHMKIDAGSGGGVRLHAELPAPQQPSQAPASSR